MPTLPGTRVSLPGFGAAGVVGAGAVGVGVEDPGEAPGFGVELVPPPPPLHPENRRVARIALRIGAAVCNMMIPLIARRCEFAGTASPKRRSAAAFAVTTSSKLPAEAPKDATNAAA